MSSFIVELGQKLLIMAGTFCVLGLFAAIMSIAIAWCNEKPETTLKVVTLNIIAIGMLIVVGAILFFTVKELT